MKHKILTFFLACLVPWLAGAQQSANSQNNVAEKDYIAYLFTYFTGNHISEEAVCYAVSTDGYTYWALNDNKPVIDSKIISSTGGVRDPHIRRSQDGHTFYMVVTDMVSGYGWSSNRAMILLKSKDLVHWTSNIVNIQKKYPNANLSDVPSAIGSDTRTEAGRVRAIVIGGESISGTEMRSLLIWIPLILPSPARTAR